MFFDRLRIKILSLTLILILISVIISPIQFAASDSNTHNVTISTGEKQLGPATIVVEYSIDFDFSRPPSVHPGDSVDLSLTPKNAKLKVIVDVGGVSHTLEKDLTLGSSIDMDVSPGIKAYVSTSVSGNPTIQGPGSTSVSQLTWSNSNAESFPLSVPSTAQGGEQISIRVPISVNINAGLKLDLLGILKQDLGQVQLGSFEAVPVIEENIPVVSQLPIELIILLTIPIVIAIGIIVYLKKFRKSTGLKKTSVSEKTTKSCPFCNANIPDIAKFCGKCGKKF